MDSFSPAERSRIMARIRSVGTKPEERLFALLRSVAGPRRRIDRNVRELPGTPDVYVPSLRLAVFVDGCFFHGCPQHCRIPSSNRDYWIPKIARNRRRDRRAARQLRAQGIAVWRIWEHGLTAAALPATTRRLAKAIQKRALQLKKTKSSAPFECHKPRAS